MEIISRHCHGNGCPYFAGPEYDDKHFITVPETLEEANLLAQLTGVITNAAGPFEAQMVMEPGGTPLEPVCRYCGRPVNKEGEVHAGGCGCVG